MTARLDALRDLLVLTREDTFEFHIKVFGGVYKKAVLDTMGSTGIIVPAMRKPLGDLRDRLGVSEEACAGLFLEAVEERMTPMVEWIVRETERTMLSKEQLSKKREMDYGEDYFKSGKVSDVSSKELCFSLFFYPWHQMSFSLSFYFLFFSK